MISTRVLKPEPVEFNISRSDLISSKPFKIISHLRSDLRSAYFFHSFANKILQASLITVRENQVPH
jgi:hypothetical protein